MKSRSTFRLDSILEGGAKNQIDSVWGGGRFKYIICLLHRKHLVKAKAMELRLWKGNLGILQLPDSSFFSCLKSAEHSDFLSYKLSFPFYQSHTDSKTGYFCGHLISCVLNPKIFLRCRYTIHCLYTSYMTCKSIFLKN